MQNSLERNAFLDHTFNNVEEAIFLIDGNARFVTVNEKACESLGYTREELLTLGVSDIEPDFTLEHWQEYQAARITTEQHGAVETRHKTKDGRIFPVEVRGTYITYQERYYNLAMVRDISDRKRAEKQLHLLNHALDKVSEFVWLIDENAKFQYNNAEAYRTLGYTNKELLQLSVSDINPDFQLENWSEHWQDVKANGSLTFESYNRTKEGRIFPVEINANYFEFDGQSYNLAFVRDITERKEAEKKLTLLNYALDHIGEAALLVDENAKFHYNNAEACRATGYSREELLELGVPDIDPDYQLDIWPAHWQELKTHGSKFFESRHRTKEGRIFPVDINANYFEFDGKGYNLALIRDITERKEAEKKLALLNYALDHVNESAWLIDENAKIHYVNEAACRATGYLHEELLSLTIPDIDPDYQWEHWNKHWQDLEINTSIVFETIHKSKEGVVFPVQVNSSHFEFDGKKYVLSFTHDITESKKAQEALQRSENLLAEAQRIAHIGSWEIDFSIGELSWSNETYRIWEIDKSQFGATVEAFYETVHPEDREKVAKAYNESVENKTSYQIEHRLLFPDGRIKYIAERGEPFCDENGDIIRFVGTAMDITERCHIDETLKFIAQRGWKNDSNESFLVALTQYLAQIFGVDYVIIDKLGSEITQAETIALYTKGDIVPNIQYDLKGTPCADVMNGNFCCYPENIQQLFPDDLLLVEMQAESYAGLPLWNTNGEVVGLIAVLDTKPMNDVSFISSILQLVATSVAAELERQRSEQVLLNSRHFLKQIIDTLADPVFVKDREHRWVLLNQEFCEFIGHPLEVLLGKSDYDFFPKHEADVFWEKDEIVFSSGEENINEEKFTDSAGVLRTIITKKTCYTDRNGQQFLVGIISDVSERQRIENELVAREIEFRTLAENVPGILIRYDEKCRMRYINQKLIKDCNKQGEWIGQTLIQIYPNNALFAELHEIIKKVIETGQPTEIERYFPDHQGGTTWIFAYVVERDTNDKIVGVLALGRDVTERKQMEEKLRQHAQEFRILVETSPSPIIRYDANCRRVYVNPAVEKMSGKTAVEMIEHTPVEGTLLSEYVKHNVEKLLRRVLETGQSLEGEEELVLADKQTHYFYNRYSPEFDAEGNVIGVVLIGHDITERKQVEQKMEYQASYDMLTGLPNRRMFNNRLNIEILKAKRSNARVALLFIDLDNFKEVNDMLGHETGDNLLIEAAKRIQRCVRETDTVARLGGDEFVAIFEAELIPPLERIAGAIIDTLAHPFQLNENIIYISASLGIAVYPQDATDGDTLMACADQAMYASKGLGRNNFSFFTRSMQEQAHERLMIINNLRLAIEKQQLQMYYQPIVDVKTGKIVKAEALIRWIHPTLGMVSPAVFIPLAEETNLIQEIGTWVFQQAAKTAHRWNVHSGEDKQLKISINMSPRQLTKGNGDQMAIEYLQLMNINPNFVVIEITEGLLLDDSPQIIEKLERLQATGIELSLDDFGTGYSAISYLKKFNLDYLKIDRSFVKDLETEKNDVAIAEAIVVMAHRLGLKIIAEGVETQGQRDLLATAGCEYIQGYFYAKPMPKEEFLAFILH